MIPTRAQKVRWITYVSEKPSDTNDDSKEKRDVSMVVVVWRWWWRVCRRRGRIS